MTTAPDDVARLRAAMAAAGDVAYEWNIATDAIAWIGPIAALLGSRSPDLVSSGEELHARVNAEDLPLRLKLLADETGLAEGYDCEYRLRRADGAFCWVHDRGCAELSDDGEVVCLRGVLRIVDRRKAHEVSL